MKLYSTSGPRKKRGLNNRTKVAQGTFACYQKIARFLYAFAKTMYYI